MPATNTISRSAYCLYLQGQYHFQRPPLRGAHCHCQCFNFNVIISALRMFHYRLNDGTDANIISTIPRYWYIRNNDICGNLKKSILSISPVSGCQFLLSTISCRVQYAIQRTHDLCSSRNYSARQNSEVLALALLTITLEKAGPAYSITDVGVW